MPDVAVLRHGIRAGNDDGLFGQCLSYVCSRRLPRRGASLQSWAASFFSPAKRVFLVRDIAGEDRVPPGIKSRTENALQCRMYLGQKAGIRLLACVVCAARSSSKPQSWRVRRFARQPVSACVAREAGTGSFGNDGSVTSISFSFTGGKSAMRRMASPGRYPTRTPSSGQRRQVTHRW